MTARALKPPPTRQEPQPQLALVVNNLEEWILLCRRPIMCHKCIDFEECAGGNSRARERVQRRGTAWDGIERIMDAHDAKDLSEDEIAWIARLIRRASVL